MKIFSPRYRGGVDQFNGFNVATIVSLLDKKLVKPNSAQRRAELKLNTGGPRLVRFLGF